MEAVIIPQGYPLWIDYGGEPEIVIAWSQEVNEEGNPLLAPIVWSGRTDPTWVFLTAKECETDIIEEQAADHGRG